MIVVYHKNNKISKVVSNGKDTIPFNTKGTISEGLLLLAAQFPESRIAWCEESYQEYLDIWQMKLVFYHDKMFLSYRPGNMDYLGTTIGYVDESPFIKINKKVRYPTWQMSSFAGMVHASILLKIKDQIKPDDDFDYYLNSIAKVCMPLGLLCYSEPRLLKSHSRNSVIKTNLYTLFRFVKQHYRTRWVFLLLFNLFLYERKFPFFPFLVSFFYKNRTKIAIDLEGIKVQSSKKVIDKVTMDVIIPTIGRKHYLYDVLKDFSKQTLLPNKIIIVEQNPEVGSTSELDYLTNEKWPFEIQHIFTHQPGVCNARNLALNETQSEWIFLADDDNRFENTLLSNIFCKIEQYGNEVVTTSYPQKNEIKKYGKIIQWPTFGAGNSFVRKTILANVKFNNAFEFGYGEDGDFGMQLRNRGHDVLYLPEPEILHLKAPIGGFRTKPVLQWQNDSIQPKPSPTVMLYQILHNTKAQTNSYKMILFFKYYKHQTIKNPVRYYIHFQKQWASSVFWANKLKQQNEV